MIVLDQFINNNIKQGKGDKMNFNNDFDALNFLKSREYTEKHGVILSIKTPDDEEWDAISCDCCGCSIPIHGTNLENAIDKWNERKIKI